jgi:hypothetical protein
MHPLDLFLAALLVALALDLFFETFGALFGLE